jgi:predicted MFS family arabinose efflux permease
MAVALTVYAGGTLVAAISWNTAILYLGWSLIQGSAAAVIFPLTFTVSTVSYEGDDRAKAFGLLAGVSGVGSTLGPIIGSALTTYASWRMGIYAPNRRCGDYSRLRSICASESAVRTAQFAG